jgi:hypothetical protein
VIAIALGIAVGFATGASAVRILQPPGVADADTGTTDSTRKPRRDTDAGPAAESEEGEEDAASRVMGILVPKLVGLEEGDARLAITHAGFSVGSVLFQSSGAPAGTVLSSFPEPGESVPLPATVNLILSDGRPRADSLDAPAQPDSVSLASTAS